MILEEEKYILNDKEVVLRSARLDEAQIRKIPIYIISRSMNINKVYLEWFITCKI